MKALRITLFLAVAAGYVIYSNVQPDPHFYRRLAMAIAVIVVSLVTRNPKVRTSNESDRRQPECSCR